MEANRSGVPLGAFHVVDGNERWLAPHRQSHVTSLQSLIHNVSEPVDLVPLFVGVRLRHARVFVRASDRHLEPELDLALIDAAADRSRRLRSRCRGERNVTFAREQSRRRVQPNPTGSGKKHLGPRMEIGEVLRCSRRPFERLEVGRQLNQIPRHKPRRETEAAQHLHQQPRRIATRTRSLRERFLRTLHARL